MKKYIYLGKRVENHIETLTFHRRFGSFDLKILVDVNGGQKGMMDVDLKS